MFKHSRNPFSVFAGAIAAGLLGAGIGMLFAPKKGRDLRKDISKTAKDTSDTVRDSVTEFGGTVRDTFTETRRSLMSDDAVLREDLEERLDAVKGTLTKIRFDAAVDQVVARTAREKQWTKSESDKKAGQLKRLWPEFRPVVEADAA